MGNELNSCCERCPKYLSGQEMLNPMECLKTFFSLGWPKKHAERLKEWRDAVISYSYYSHEMNGPGYLILTHEINVKLLEALDLLIKSQDAVLKPEISRVQLRGEKLTWSFFPTNLSIRETLKPYEVIRKAFEEISLSTYRTLLREWLQDALTVKSKNEMLTPSEIVPIYENLLKIYSAAWIIFLRSEDEV